MPIFAGTFSEKVTRTVRQFSPHLAAKMRPPLTPVIRGRPSAKRAIYICGRPRWVFVLIFASATLLHASFRTPNLKARLNTFREEFRAVWRNYSDLLAFLEASAFQKLDDGLLATVASSEDRDCVLGIWTFITKIFDSHVTSGADLYRSSMGCPLSKVNV
ncbi:unnamed protein product [Thlaspi arvense]|uniref:Uncharacterized protein n=1 Tax=Thlaspi arvense TaxID=13288 RepID=A0AAU9RRP1_THLAR|nr:unnamed protein product [Thlaspi arvense]